MKRMPDTIRMTTILFHRTESMPISVGKVIEFTTIEDMFNSLKK